MNPGDITEDLAGVSRGDPLALERLLPVVYNQMRRILVDHARRRQALKRGGEQTMIGLEPSGEAGPNESVSLLLD